MTSYIGHESLINMKEEYRKTFGLVYANVGQTIVVWAIISLSERPSDSTEGKIMLRPPLQHLNGLLRPSAKVSRQSVR